MSNATGIKHGGRQKGTPNRLTKELRLILKDIIFREIKNIEDNLDQLNPKERLELLVKLMPFVLPKTINISHIALLVE
jgi:23S rRNA C2498 (ribose-2'-O)-methylase RlmM